MKELNIMSITKIIEEYFRLHNYSKRTFKSYIRNLQKFNIYLKDTFDLTDFRDVTSNHLYQFIEYLSKKPTRTGHKRKTTTINLMILSIKSIFKILEQEETILFNPLINITTIKCKKTIRDKILTHEEIEKVLCASDLSTNIGVRNRAILEVLYGTGIRAGELLNLKMNDFLINEKMLHIQHGKGNKDRIIPLGDKTFSILLQYVKIARKKLLKRKRINVLFISKKNKALTHDGLRSILKGIKQKIDIQKSISPHVIRHTYATHLLNNGADIRMIQHLLGHSTIKSTQVYTNLKQNHLKKEYERYHPLENELYLNVCSCLEDIITGKTKATHRIIKKKLT